MYLLPLHRLIATSAAGHEPRHGLMIILLGSNPPSPPILKR